MTTPKQKAANGDSAKGSTGPKTRKGKEKSRMNSYKHGLTAKKIVLEEEDPKMFEGLRHDLVEHFQPYTLIQEFLVDKLAMLMWRLRRADLLEQALFEYQSTCADVQCAGREVYAASTEARRYGAADKKEKLQSKMHKLEQAQYKGKAKLGFALVNDARSGNAFTKLSAYDARNLRDFYRTLDALERDLAAGRAKANQSPDPQTLVQDRKGPNGETRQIEGPKDPESPSTA